MFLVERDLGQAEQPNLERALHRSTDLLLVDVCVLVDGACDVALPVALGAIAFDLPTFLFYGFEKLTLGTPEHVIRRKSYFAPSWQAIFDAVKSRRRGRCLPHVSIPRENSVHPAQRARGGLQLVHRILPSGLDLTVGGDDSELQKRTNRV